MRLISVNALKEGEKLYTNITNCKGIVMLKHGSALTESYIERLRNFGIYAVYVDDEFSDDMEIRPALSNDTKLRILETISTMQKSLAKGKKVDFSIAKKMSHDIYDEVSTAALKPINLVNTYAVDYPVLLHSINVASVVAALASKAGIRPELAENFVTAALFHDITLSNMAEDEDPAHADAAFKLLKNSALIGPTTYMSVAMHHEKYNGGGAPNGLTGDKINDGARLIAVADLYDNLTYGYGGHSRLSPYAAVEYLVSESGKSLDPTFTELFTQCVAVYPTGATVLLNNGQEAVVVSQNAGLPTRPVVRLLDDAVGDPNLLDLLWEHTVFINELYL